MDGYYAFGAPSNSKPHQFASPKISGLIHSQAFRFRDGQICGFLSFLGPYFRDLVGNLEVWKPGYAKI